MTRDPNPRMIKLFAFLCPFIADLWSVSLSDIDISENIYLHKFNLKFFNILSLKLFTSSTLLLMPGELYILRSAQRPNERVSADFVIVVVVPMLLWLDFTIVLIRSVYWRTWPHRGAVDCERLQWSVVTRLPSWSHVTHMVESVTLSLCYIMCILDIDPSLHTKFCCLIFI